MSRPKAPKRAFDSESDDYSPSTERQRRATQKRARVSSPDGRDLAGIEKGKEAIWISSSSEDEAPESAQPTPIPSPHISDSDTDEPSLYSLEPLRKKRGAEILSKEYNPGNPDFSESDDESVHGKTTESSLRSGENNHDNYPIRYLKARRKELEDKLDEIKQVKVKELELTGQLIQLSQAISALESGH